MTAAAAHQGLPIANPGHSYIGSVHCLMNMHNKAMHFY